MTMQVKVRPFRPLALSLRLSASALLVVGLHASETTFPPTTVEVDLVFPRNESYAPSALFPIVFAFQNPALIPSLYPYLSFDVWYLDNLTAPPLLSDPVDLRQVNFFADGPTYVYKWIRQLNASDNGSPLPLRLMWSFDTTNCSGGGLAAAALPNSRAVDFTVKDGAGAPNLAMTPASSSNTTALCAAAGLSYFAFNVTGTVPAPEPSLGDLHPNRTTCAVLSDQQPYVVGNPCAAQLGSAAASSISAAITSAECGSYLALMGSAVVSCPPSSTATAKSAARWASGSRDQRLWHMAFLSAFWIVFLCYLYM
jgi:hypothetical protein